MAVRQSHAEEVPGTGVAEASATLWDVLVVGAGNAALSAALTARRHGASVLVLESAGLHLRGGNSRHVRNIRYAHPAATDFVNGPYDVDEYLDDVMRVTEGHTDLELARVMVERSQDAVDWMMEQGVKFQPPLTGTLALGRTNAFFLGGGRALMNSYFKAAKQLGIRVLYDTEVEDVDIDGLRFGAVLIRHGGRDYRVAARSVVLASGGFESNLEWLRDAWGDAAENFLVRGTPMNTGKVLRAVLDRGAESIAEPDQCHAVAVDGRSPQFDGGIATRVDCVIFSIVVNKNAERFYDEGEDIWPRRYAIWGRLIADQPEQVAYAIIDSQAMGLFMPPVFPPYVADNLAGLAEKLGIDATGLERTVSTFNAAVQPGNFDPAVPDGCATRGLSPPKSNWARPIVKPPFYGYPVKTGITFTYLGVKTDTTARVVMRGGAPTENVWAAGEIMAGNILGRGYAAGVGMAIGTVFGRIAGEEAAAYARS